MEWPTPQALTTARFSLEPVTTSHAEEMVFVLAPRELYAFTGGQPPTMDQLTARYERQSRGESPAGDAGWLNWIVRDERTGRAIGFIQSTITLTNRTFCAEVAWLITPTAQGYGAATEATAAIMLWLQTQGVRHIRASIHPDHRASARVAERIGLEATSEMHDGERIWAIPTN